MIVHHSDASYCMTSPDVKVFSYYTVSSSSRKHAILLVSRYLGHPLNSPIHPVTISNEQMFLHLSIESPVWQRQWQQPLNCFSNETHECMAYPQEFLARYSVYVENSSADRIPGRLWLFAFGRLTVIREITRSQHGHPFIHLWIPVGRLLSAWKKSKPRVSAVAPKTAYKCSS